MACGTGKSTEPLVRSGLEVYGVDHDPLMIDEAKKQASQKGLSIQYAVADVQSLPFADEYFDAVIVGTAFHWFVNQESLQELRRVLKKSGLLYIFWTQTTKDISEEDSIPVEIFRSVNWEKVPAKLRDLEHISSFLRKNGLRDVTTARIPFEHNDTVEEQVGLIKTASNYELLSEEEKRRFIQEVEKALTKQLGTRPYFTYEEELQICYGFK